MSNKDTDSHKAFHELLDTLREAADEWLSPERGIEREDEVVEGLRNVLHLLSGGIDFYLEGDPERPEFIRIVSPTRRFMGDNPDAVYFFSRIRGDRSYRIRGVRTDECYLSFTIHGRAEDGSLGPTGEPVLADVSDRGFKFGADGSYEIILCAEEPASAGQSDSGTPINWLQLPEGAASILTRHYFEVDEPEPPAVTRGDRIQLKITAIEDAPVRPPLCDAPFAARLRDVAAFVQGGKGLEMPNPPPFVSQTPNEVGQPTIFRMAGTTAWGAVDIAYSMGPFELGDGEALLMEGRLPECAFANVVLWNRYLRTFEFRDRRVSLNRKQIKLEPDGSYKIVLAASDPGPTYPNWLDTVSHAHGTIFWRMLLPEGEPQKPACRVVKLAELTEP